MTLGEQIYNKFKTDKVFNFDKNGNPMAYNDGFMVSVKGFGGAFNPSSRRAIIQRINEMLKQIKGLYRNCVIGFWVDEQGVLFVDLSINVNDFYVAMILGLHNGQEAIYDCKENKVISIDEYLQEMED